MDRQDKYNEIVRRTGRAYAAVDILERYHPDDDKERHRALEGLSWYDGYLTALQVAAEAVDADLNEWRRDSIRKEVECWQEVLDAEAQRMHVDHIRQTRDAMARHMETLEEAMA